MDVRELSHWSIYQRQREVVLMSTTRPAHEWWCHHAVPLRSVKRSFSEADLVAAITACGRTIRIAQFADDWSYHAVGRVHVDSSAAIGVAHRRYRLWEQSFLILQLCAFSFL